MFSDDPLWYKDAVIYELHVRAFCDSNGDGIGDFAGLTEKLDYLRDLGVNTLWLLPFYPSPLRDDGYDIAKYEDIHPSYGTLKDFRTFLREAHARGLRVITELVINHTSDQHPWFQAARRAPKGSPKRDFYVWSETNQKYSGVRIIFTDSEKSNWTWDDTAGAYYWHRFFSHQPDLNFDNPQVLRAVLRVMRFWFEMGVDGMRLDAIPYLIEREGTICENLPETHEVLKSIRRELDARFSGKFLLAEANQWPADVAEYFGSGDECHMAFHFPLMPRIFMAIRQEDRHPITEIMRQTPDIPPNCQWAIFLRNHDELTLEMVTDDERDYLYQSYAADPQMRINVGIRRRLAPLLDNSRRRTELLNSILFSFPGTPVLYYGDEIGMGDNVYLGDRNGVRTPMQWTGDRNAGFSKADPARLYSPVVMDPVYGYQAVNVESQERSPYSLLNWMKRMIALRRQRQVFGRGTLQFLRPSNRKILAYVRRLDDEIVVCVANLARTVQPVELNLSDFKGFTPIEMLGQTEFPRIGDQPYVLTLPPFGFYWFNLQLNPAQLTPRAVAQEPQATEEAPALFMGAAWDTLLEGNVRALVERDLLAGFLQRQRWFGAKTRTIASARFVDWGVVQRSPAVTFTTIIETIYSDGGRDEYFLPLTAATGATADAVVKNHPNAVLARISGARKGLLYDALADASAADALLNTIAQEQVIRMRRGTVRGFATGELPAIAGDAPLEPSVSSTEQSNSMLAFGNRLLMKLYRRVQHGPNPDVELTRFITERTDFRRVPALAGSIEYERPGQPPASLAMLQQRVQKQADGWTHALDELSRYYERVTVAVPPDHSLLTPSNGPFLALARAEVPDQAAEAIGAYLTTAATLGRRTAEMHLALTKDTIDAEFAPEPLAGDALGALADTLTTDARRALTTIDRRLSRLPDDTVRAVRELLDRRDDLLSRLGAVAELSDAGQIARVHGDYHLAQVLWSENDFYIIDFEGEPARSLEERRAKRSPLKDVAGMVRSFSYAAYAGLHAFTTSRPDAARVEPWACAWQTWVAGAFLRAYLQTAEGAPFLPSSPASAERLLDALAIDKALYELEYELNNRPEWVRIPLWGILPLLRTTEMDSTRA